MWRPEAVVKQRGGSSRAEVSVFVELEIGLMVGTVGGTLVSKVERISRSGTIALVRRRSSLPVDWSCQQPLPMLLWMRSGLQKYRLDIGGSVFASNTPTPPTLVVVPAQARVLGEV